MNLPANWINLMTTLVSAMLTIIVFSYIFGDHFLFRITIALFIGVTAGFGVISAVQSILYPMLIQPLLQNPTQGLIKIAFPLILSLLLLFKLSPRWSFVGNPSLALMAGVGAATVVGGAIKGTLFPQILASINQFDIQALKPAGVNPIVGFVEGGIIVIGTITTLAHFHFGARPSSEGKPQRGTWLETLSWIGQLFIAVALGWIFSGVLRAGYVALLERVRFVLLIILNLLRGIQL